jgi:hypothetical protein
LIVTSNSRIFNLKLNIVDTHKINYEAAELIEKTNFLRKFISSFVPSAETNKIQVLNTHKDCIFLLNEHYLKRINIGSEKVNLEVNLFFLF